MDPSVFFGRGRVTRQRLQPLSSWKENVDREVRKGDKKENAKASKEVKQSEEKERKVGKKIKEAKSKETPRKKNVKNGCSKVPASKKVTAKKPSGKKAAVEEAETGDGKSGPVYQNVRRSDVIGDPTNEYDFLVDENSLPVKKKPRKKNPVKKATKDWQGIVKWDPSKRPIIVKCVPAKSSKSKVPQTPKLNAGSPILKARSCKEAKTTKEIIPEEQQPLGGKLQKPIDVTDITKVQVTSQKPVLISSAIGTSSRALNNVTSTPSTNTSVTNVTLKDVAQPASSVGLSSTVADVIDKQTSPSPIATSRSSIAPVPICFSTPDGSSNSPRIMKAASCSTRLGSSTSTPLMRSASAAKSSTMRAKLNSPTVSTAATCSTSSSSNASIPVICPVSAAKPSTSKTTPAAQSSLSRSSVTCSPLPVSSTPARPIWAHAHDESDFDLDFEVDNSLPTRMFSTHRGTMFAPVHESNVTKRKLPKFSPQKNQNVPKASAIKFVSPRSSTDLDDQQSALKAPEQLTVNNCFGFEEVDAAHALQEEAAPHRILVTTTQTKRKEAARDGPRVSIERVKALLRGEIKVVTPRSIRKTPFSQSPGSIQTKLTDFVCSTPTSMSVRSAKPTDSPVLTPTPVPLFGEEQMDPELPSPYTQTSRRSYDRIRPVKRIAYGDEVHSDDEVGDMPDPNLMESTAPGKKKGRSYKKKKPQDPQFDQWADQLASHFDEVEEVELEME